MKYVKIDTLDTDLCSVPLYLPENLQQAVVPYLQLSEVEAFQPVMRLLVHVCELKKRIDRAQHRRHTATTEKMYEEIEELEAAREVACKRQGLNEVIGWYRRRYNVKEYLALVELAAARYEDSAADAGWIAASRTDHGTPMKTLKAVFDAYAVQISAPAKLELEPIQSDRQKMLDEPAFEVMYTAVTQRVMLDTKITKKLDKDGFIGLLQALNCAEAAVSGYAQEDSAIDPREYIEVHVYKKSPCEAPYFVDRYVKLLYATIQVIMRNE